MKKILALMLCIIMVCAMPFAVYAEGELGTPAEEETDVTENPTVEETPSESENEGEEIAPEPTPEPTPESTPEDNAPETSITEQAKTIAEKVVAWVKENFPTISTIGTTLLAILYYMLKFKDLGKSITTLNNNSVTIANNSAEAVKGASEIIAEYKQEMSDLLSEYRKTAEDNKRLEEALANVESYLINAMKANIEFSNELAELLILSNIPNAKKDELYSVHRDNVALIMEAMKVIENDREEA
jgi:hypothetical protein